MKNKSNSLLRQHNRIHISVMNIASILIPFNCFDYSETCLAWSTLKQTLSD